jgi:hypothetical protein
MSLRISSHRVIRSQVQELRVQVEARIVLIYIVKQLTQPSSKHFEGCDHVHQIGR